MNAMLVLNHVLQGACIIHGLEEAVVSEKNEVYKILEQGALRRQTAGTLMNTHSRWGPTTMYMAMVGGALI